MSLKNLIWLCWLGLLGACPVNSLAAPSAPSSVAFFYGAQPPWAELQAFDLMVVDPDHVPSPLTPVLPQTQLAAYVALGEVQPSRSYAAQIPKAWFVGQNKDWGSRVIDQSQPDWPRFFTQNVIAPLWGKGWRRFFLDTLDSYQLFAKTSEQRAMQQAGMVAVIRALKQRYPEIELIFNRGFEILPTVHTQVAMVVAESLYQGFDAGKGSFKEVSEPDQAWLLAQLQRIKNTYKLPVVVIDYVPAAKRQLARDTAKRIQSLGFIPWVTTPDLSSLGVGAVEVLPRRIAVVHSLVKDEYALREIGAVRFAAMPLQYLGYEPEYFDPLHLPAFSLAGRFAAVLLWLDAEPAAPDLLRLGQWLKKQTSEGVPIAMLGTPSFLMEGSMGSHFGFTLGEVTTTGDPVQIDKAAAMMGYERSVSPQASEFYPLSIQPGQALLSIKRGQQTQVAAALTPWGGYVLSAYDVVNLPGNAGDRWVIDPFAFFKQAMRLPDMPVPDVTTESGRRMLMVHMDGDGFISRSELPGNPMAGEVVLERVVKKYPIPMTISVIEAELSAQGLYPSLSAAAEKIAQNIFKAPHVAIASHSYSHPFYWGKVAVDDPNGGYNLRLPGYRFDLDREIKGSIDYIQTRLAPPDKKVSLFLWTGDCVPGAQAIEKTEQVGVYNMNGGDTIATRSSPTLTEVEGLGMPRGKGYQVFAPNQNENVYTNNWRGPFYGFERVIETYEFTETPRRLKPIDIYFHTYITTKAAGMKSLDKVFAFALAQETTPVHVTDYAQKVLDFGRIAVARTATGWRVRGAHALRSLRLPAGLGLPDVAQSQGVAGFAPHPSGVFVHLSADTAELTLQSAPVRQPHLVSANGRIDGFETLPNGWRWQLRANVPLQFTLANAQSCQVRAGGRELVATRSAGALRFFNITSHVARPLEAICRS